MVRLLNNKILHFALLCVSALVLLPHVVEAQEINTALDSVIMHLNLEEVVVTAKKITQRADTISYSAATYRSNNDRTLEDLLRKMPGIKVSSDGQISYNGQWIKEFYIEGMDMLGDNYSVATKNIDAQAIGSVQLMEDHQDVKLLRGIKRGNAPAMNIRLRQNAKNIWSSTLAGAIGIQPELAWDASATLMNIRHNSQNFSVYKTNNVGEDLRPEINAPTSFNSSLGTGILTADKPALSDKYAYKNKSHSVSLNQLLKISDEKILTFNLNYLYDREKRESNEETSYLSEDLSRYLIQESNTSDIHQHFMGTHAVYKLNGSKNYVKNTLSASASFPEGGGIIDGLIRQNISGHVLNFDDILNINYKKRGGGIADATFHACYNDRNALLSLPESGFAQMVTGREFKADGLTSLVAVAIPHLMFNLNGSFDTEYQQAITDRTALYPELDIKDSGSGDQRTWQVAASATPKLLWHYGQRFQWLFYVPTGVRYYHSDNGSWAYGKAMLSLKPYTNISYKPSDKLSFDLTAICDESMPSALSLMAAGRYTNYRTTISNPNHLQVTQNRKLSTAFNIGYKSVLDMMFGNLTLTYVQAHNGSSSGYTIQDDVINYVLLPEASESRVLQADQSFSKGFFLWNSKISEQVSVGVSHSGYYVGGALHEGRSDYLRANLSFNASFAEWISFDTSNDFSLSRSFTDGQVYGNIWHTFTSSSTLTISPMRDLSMVPSVIFYNNNYSTAYRNNVFLNCSLEYAIKDVLLFVKGSNLLDNNVFHRYTDNGIVCYSSQYMLRGRTVMLGIRINYTVK